ncbi:MAG: LysE family translocator [Alphaproteobacteria bacterium]|nr:LysE family translocator [Alphaproteobacteria bacterium]
MLSFAAAVFLLIVTPGPGVLSVAGVGSGFGFRAGNRYLAGLWLGNNAVALLVASGIAAVVLAEPVIRTVLLFASVAYLLYLAGRIALAGSKIAFIEKQSPPGLLNGLTLQLINPKAYAVHTTLFGGFPFLPTDLFAETLIKFVVMNVIWIPLHYLWLGAGLSLRRLDLAPGVQRAINVGMALAMLGVVALALLAPSAA